jgi:hypothetical protein
MENSPRGSDARIRIRRIQQVGEFPDVFRWPQLHQGQAGFVLAGGFDTRRNQLS